MRRRDPRWQPHPESGRPEPEPSRYLPATEVRHVLSDPEGEGKITHTVNLYTEAHDLD